MERKHFLQAIERAFKMHPICALLGPRQCGKTTLSKQYAKTQFLPVHWFDLEDSADLAKLENPRLMFAELEGLIIIDEIQMRPDLFPLLRVLADNYKKRFLISGSASRDLVNHSSETLAGRVSHIELTPFNLGEVHDAKRLWLQGGFPLSYLADNIEDSIDWRKSFIKNFLERDIPMLGINIPAETLRRFWVMLTHYHGNIFNASEIGRSLGYSDTTIKHYLDILIGTFMVRRLAPWTENIKKRQIKSPKIYLRDSGILHNLMGITQTSSLYEHPKLGASWEGFALEEVIRYHGVDAEDCYFWGTHGQAELDLLIVQQDKKQGFEFKYTEAPKVTTSMNSALTDLNLDKITVIVPGNNNFPLSEKIRVIGLESYVRAHDT